MSIYLTAADIARNVEGGAGLRSQLYSKELVKEQSHLPEINFLVNNALQKKEELDELIAETKLKEKLRDTDLWLARILTTELVLGKKSFKVFCPVSKIVYSKKADLKAAGARMKITKKPETNLPRYVRVDVNIVTLPEVHKYLERAGYKLGKYDDYALVPKNGYCVDIHVPALLVFNMKAPVHTFDWVTSGCLILQDKASCLVAPLLAPHPCSTALDMCAAPGFKTHHLASFMHGLGKIIAVEINRERFQTLLQLKQKFSLDNLMCINSDVLESRTFDKFKLAVEYILLDPPCSGSGIAKNYDFSPNAKSDAERYEKLHNLQVKMLKSALSDYPAARRVTYSTCSITEEENESVIDEVLKNVPGGFSLVDLTPFYPGLSRGRSSFKCGSKCIRLSPETDKTNGFFIAMFERIAPPALPLPVEMPYEKERGKKRSAKEALNTGGKKSKTQFAVEENDTSSEKDVEEDDDDAEQGVDSEDSGEEENEDDDEGEEGSGEDSEVEGFLGFESTGETAKSSDEDDDTQTKSNEGNGTNEKPDSAENGSDSEEEDESDEGTSKDMEEASNQHGPRQYWAKGHKRFGGGGSSNNRGKGDPGSRNTNSESASEWSPRGRGGFRGGRGGRSGRGYSGGGDRGGRGNFRGGDRRGRGGRGHFSGGRGNSRGGRGYPRGGDRGGRGGFRGGRGGFRGSRGGGSSPGE